MCMQLSHFPRSPLFPSQACSFTVIALPKCFSAAASLTGLALNLDRPLTLLFSEEFKQGLDLSERGLRRKELSESQAPKFVLLPDSIASRFSFLAFNTAVGVTVGVIVDLSFGLTGSENNKEKGAVSASIRQSQVSWAESNSLISRSSFQTTRKTRLCCPLLCYAVLLSVHSLRDATVHTPSPYRSGLTWPPPVGLPFSVSEYKKSPDTAQTAYHGEYCPFSIPVRNILHPTYISRTPSFLLLSLPPSQP
ncbi:uncharacterized protein UDID_18501 [Ustilago sp. UG-2017a]|nr:uncharacterized protein UDID_18501 [Ustilago sp. UG-2017a]